MKYIFRNGMVLEFSYDGAIHLDSYELKEGEHWVTSEPRLDERANDGRFISNELAGAIKKYTRGNAYRDIRQVQQNEREYAKKNGVDKLNKYKVYGDMLENFIHTSRTFSGDLWRGINTNNTYHIGQVIDMRGTSSWSEDKGVAEEYSKGDKKRVVFHTRDVGVGISLASAKEHEQEVLVSKEEKFVVRDIQKGEITYIELDRI